MRLIALSTLFACCGCMSRPKIPDLPGSEAARIISSAPEFSRYAHLVRVEHLSHPTDSLDFATFGTFTFQYLNAPENSQPIEGTVDFRYYKGKWYLNQFNYGCPGHCEYVYVYDDPNKKH